MSRSEPVSAARPERSWASRYGTRRGGGCTEVTTGSSYIQAVGWDGGRCPVARTLLTYSQSANPNSPHFSDQTRLFSAEPWVTSRFCEKDIMSSPALRVARVRS
ncbi:penicillin acylase family protein [Streptomyces sp. NPDC003015]